MSTKHHQPDILKQSHISSVAAMLANSFSLLRPTSASTPEKMSSNTIIWNGFQQFAKVENTTQVDIQTTDVGVPSPKTSRTGVKFSYTDTRKGTDLDCRDLQHAFDDLLQPYTKYKHHHVFWQKSPDVCTQQGSKPGISKILNVPKSVSLLKELFDQFVISTLLQQLETKGFGSLECTGAEAVLRHLKTSGQALCERGYRESMSKGRIGSNQGTTSKEICVNSNDPNAKNPSDFSRKDFITAIYWLFQANQATKLCQFQAIQAIISCALTVRFLVIQSQFQEYIALVHKYVSLREYTNNFVVKESSKKAISSSANTESVLSMEMRQGEHHNLARGEGNDMADQDEYLGFGGDGEGNQEEMVEEVPDFANQDNDDEFDEEEDEDEIDDGDDGMYRRMGQGTHEGYDEMEYLRVPPFGFLPPSGFEVPSVIRPQPTQPGSHDIGDDWANGINLDPKLFEEMRPGLGIQGRAQSPLPFPMDDDEDLFFIRNDYL